MQGHLAESERTTLAQLGLRKWSSLDYKRWAVFFIWGQQSPFPAIHHVMSVCFGFRQFLQLYPYLPIPSCIWIVSDPVWTAKGSSSDGKKKKRRLIIATLDSICWQKVFLKFPAFFKACDLLQKKGEFRLKPASLSELALSYSGLGQSISDPEFSRQGKGGVLRFFYDPHRPPTFQKKDGN